MRKPACLLKQNLKYSIWVVNQWIAHQHTSLFRVVHFLSTSISNQCMTHKYNRSIELCLFFRIVEVRVLNNLSRGKRHTQQTLPDVCWLPWNVFVIFDLFWFRSPDLSSNPRMRSINVWGGLQHRSLARIEPRTATKALPINVSSEMLAGLEFWQLHFVFTTKFRSKQWNVHKYTQWLPLLLCFLHFAFTEWLDPTHLLYDHPSISCRTTAGSTASDPQWQIKTSQLGNFWYNLFQTFA